MFRQVVTCTWNLNVKLLIFTNFCITQLSMKHFKSLTMETSKQTCHEYWCFIRSTEYYPFGLQEEDSSFVQGLRLGTKNSLNEGCANIDSGQSTVGFGQERSVFLILYRNCVILKVSVYSMCNFKKK